MATYIRIQEYCVHYQVPAHFIDELVSAGLIEINAGDNQTLDEEQFDRLERFRQLYYDLEINLEGIETIDYLLKRQEELQHELALVKTKLRLYE